MLPPDLAAAQHRRQAGVDGRLVPVGPAIRQLADLRALDLVADPQDLHRRLDGLGVTVDADDLLVALLDLPLVGEGRLGDLGHEPAVLDPAQDPAGHRVVRAHRPDLREDLLGLGLQPVGERLDVPGAAERVGDVDHAGLLHDHLLGAQRDLGRLLARQREHLVERVRVQRVGAAEHGRQRLDRGAHDVVVRLLRGQRDPGGLGVEAQPLRPLGRGAVDVAHPACPDPARGPELGDLLEEVDVRVEEERQAGREHVDVQAAGQAELDVAEAVGERERQLLRGGRSGLPDVVAGHRQRLVVGYLGGAVLHQVADQPQVRLRREQPLLLRDVLLEDVGLQRAVELAQVGALPLGRGQVHAEHRDGGSADRHRRRDVGQRDAGEQHVHVGGRVDRHAAVPDLADRARVVGVAAHQRRHVERDRQAAAAGREQHLVALVRLHRVAEAGELPDRPRPAAVPGRVQAAGEGVLPRPADPLEAGHDRAVLRPVDRVDGHAGQGGEVGVPHPRAVVPALPASPAVVTVLAAGV